MSSSPLTSTPPERDDESSGLRDAIGGIVRGRLGVLGFQARLGISIGLTITCGLIVKGLLASTSGFGRAALDTPAVVFGYLAIAIGVGASLAIPVISIRRHHDLGRSGWWLLLTLVPVVNFFWTLYVWFMPGDDAPNRFGDVHRPNSFERVVGRAGLLLVLLLMGDHALRLHAASQQRDAAEARRETPTTPTEATSRYDERAGGKTSAAHDAAEARFLAAKSRAVRIDDKATFERLFVDRPLTFIDAPADDAPMRFERDGRLHGTFVLDDGSRDEVALVWSWRGGELCYEGTIGLGNPPLERNCGTASEVPDVGLMLERDGGRRSTERWLAD